MFPFHPSLVLSSGKKNKRSEWKLPSFFDPSTGTKMTYHGDPQRWGNYGDHCILKSVSKGQEFIISGNPKIEEWAKNLFFLGMGQSYTKTDKDPMIGDISTDKNCDKHISVDNKQNNIVKSTIPIIDCCFCISNETMIVTMKCKRTFSGEIFDVIIDVADLEKVRKYDWKVQKNYKSVYAVLQGTKNILLHRLICDDCKGKRVFARNKNYFDCRRSNLYTK